MKNWRLVDIDNYMNGNSLFPQIQNEQIWQKNVQELLGFDENGTNYFEEEQYKSNPHYFQKVMFQKI